MTPRPDAIVVGAGIIGAACAESLARAGLRVLVLERAFAGSGTTAAGMGHLVVMDDSPAQLALTTNSERLWNALLPQLPRNVEHEACGTLWVAEDEAQLDAVRAKQRLYADHGVTSELLDAAQLAEAEPRLRPGLAGALRVPDDGVIYPPTAAVALLDRARESGAELRENVTVDGIGAREVRIGTERMSCGIVVNAAGAAAPTLTPGIPIVPRKGHLVITDRYPGFCRHQLVELGYLASAHTMTTESVAFNVQPRATGQILIGSSRELVGWDPAINHAIVRRMLDRALDFMPALSRVSAIRTWTGFRPATPDKLPLIGAWDDTPGVWVAAGHEGLGITTALGTAQLLADLILEKPPAIDPAPFAPSRVHAMAGAH
ncbi:MAG TPA: FAD-dependent oxidoreductase [Candidatus Elarobacter sp.]|nr:FAD-dependent oxidoreductase [Candidatus Elarobacter sp.]